MDLDTKHRRRRWYLAAVGSLAGLTGVAAAGVVAAGSAVEGLGRLTALEPSALQQLTRPAADNSKDGDDKEKVKEVPCDTDKLIGAIARANADNGARLGLARTCTYTLTAFEDGTGLPLIEKPISIEGNGATIVRAANAEPFRIFNVGAGGDLKLRDLTVKGGDARTEGGGGALLVHEGGKATVKDTTLTLNRSSSVGGAITNFGVTKVIGDSGDHGKDGSHGKDGDSREAGSQIKNNHAQGFGGGILSTGSLTVEDSRVSYNDAGMYGGGVQIDAGVANLTRVRVDHNNALSDSGGIDLEEGATARVKDSWVTDNTSGNSSGGIGNYGGTLYLQRTKVRHNTSNNDGGGVGNIGGKTLVEDSKINENTARDFGGGVANNATEIVLRRSEVNRNRAIGAGAGGGIANGEPGTVTLTDTRVIENFATNAPGGIFSEISQIHVDDDSVIIKNRPTNCQGNPPGVEIPNCFG